MQDKREEGGNYMLNDYSGFPDPDADSVIETDPGVTRVRKRSGPAKTSRRTGIMFSKPCPDPLGVLKELVCAIYYTLFLKVEKPGRKRESCVRNERLDGKE